MSAGEPQKKSWTFYRRTVIDKPLETLASEVCDAGVLHAFGVPGGGKSLRLIHYLEEAGVRFHTTYREDAAAIMAGTAGRLGKSIGIAISIKGPGVANMMPGLAFCGFELLPMVAISEAYGVSEQSSRFHKRIDHKLLTMPTVKGSFGYGGPVEGFGRARALAIGEPPGPVLLNLADLEEDYATPMQSEPSGPDPRTVLDALRLSRRPVVLAGSSAIRFGWGSYLSRLSVPIFTTVSAKGMLDEGSSFAAGVYTGAGGKDAPESSLFAQADLVVGLGLDARELLSSEVSKQRLVNVLPSMYDWSSSYLGDLVSDKYLPEIVDGLTRKQWGLEEIRASKRKLFKSLGNKHFLPFNFFSILSQHFPENGRLVVDVGSFATIGEHVWEARDPDQFLISGNARYMGGAIPMALGAAFLNNESPVVTVLGDGGIGMHLAEVKLAVEARLPILFALLSDGGFGSIKSAVIDSGLSSRCLEKFNPSFVPAMEGLGIPGVRVTSEAELKSVLENHDFVEPYYVECHFESDPYRQMTLDLRN